MNLKNSKFVLLISITFFLLFLSINAEAAITNKDIYDTVLKDFKTAAVTWRNVIEVAATWLYWLLVTISMVFTFGFMILRKADIGELFAEFIRFTIFVGFFWWLLTNGPNFANDIIESLKIIAGNASGFGSKLSPSSIVDIGFEIVFRTIDWMDITSPLDSLVGIIMATIIFILISLIGFNILLLFVTSWILIYAGIFFLGFGGSRWTSDIAINYFKTVLGLAIQILAVILIVGIGKTFIDGYFLNMSKAIEIKEYFIMVVTTLIIYLLIDKVPPFLSGVITGASIGHNAGSVGTGTAMAAAAATMGTAALAMKSAAASIGGASSAVYNSVTQAAENVGDGSDIVSQMMGGGGNGSKNESSSGSSPLGEAMGFSNDSPVSSSMGSKAASFMADTGKMVADSTANLAQGGWNTMKENASEAMSGTIGGKIANQIKSSSETNGNNGGADMDDDGNNLSASFSNTDTTLDEEAEISAFRDKDS